MRASEPKMEGSMRALIKSIGSNGSHGPGGVIRASSEFSKTPPFYKA